jgi:hypothetical protein
VELVCDEADNRVKYVQPTSLASLYLSRMGQCIEQARQP